MARGYGSVRVFKDRGAWILRCWICTGIDEDDGECLWEREHPTQTAAMVAAWNHIAREHRESE